MGAKKKGKGKKGKKKSGAGDIEPDPIEKNFILQSEMESLT
jgi:hypothetical protein